MLEDYNHTMELRMLGTKLVMTDDPENIKAIQDTQFWEVAKSEEQHVIFKHILGDAIFASNVPFLSMTRRTMADPPFSVNGEEWKREAALYKAHVSGHTSYMRAIDGYHVQMGRVRESDFEVTERHLLNAFNLLAEDGRDAFDVIDRLQLDIVTEVFCGESTNSLTSNQQPFRDAMEKLQKIACFRQLLG